MYTCMTCELDFDTEDYVLGTDFLCPHCLVQIREIDPVQAGLISIVYISLNTYRILERSCSWLSL